LGYDKALILPYKVCINNFQDVSRVYSFLNYHRHMCNADKIHGKAIHAIQILQDDCMNILGKVKGFDQNPSFLIPYGNMPQQITTQSAINITVIPFIDLDCPVTWPVMAHETVHAIGKYAGARDSDNWMNELKCDFAATIALGPAYPLSYLLTYGLIPGRAKYLGESGPSHPYLENRLELCSEVLKKYLSYSDGFIDGWMKKAYEYVYRFETEKTSAEHEKIMKKHAQELLDGFLPNTETEENALLYGYSFEKFKKNKTAGVGKALLKGENIKAKTPATIMNALVYETIRENPDPANTKILNAVIESLQKSKETEA